MMFRNFVIFKLLPVAAVMIFMSCDQQEENSINAPSQLVDSSAHFGNKDFKFPELTAEARAQVSNWSVFDDFQMELNNINGNTIAILKTRTERLKLHADSLNKKIPNDLYTNPITSRLVVLRSRINLLNQELNKATADSARVANKLLELNVAATNFLVQINEKLQKDEIDLQRVDDEKKELEKQKRFLDSVYQAERRDKNRQ